MSDHAQDAVTPVEPSPPSVTILSYDGVDELDLFGLFSILAKASHRFSRLRLVAPRSPVLGSSGAEFVVEPLAAVDAESDVLVAPGGRGAEAAARSGVFSPTLRAVHARGGRIYCCCSGSLIAAAALPEASERLAITPRKRDLLGALFSGEIGAGLVEGNGIVSIGGLAQPSVKSVDLAFHLLASLDPLLARSVSERTEIAWRPS